MARPRHIPAVGFSAAALLVGALGWLPVAAGAYSDGPPPAHTGGFGEPSCHACHFDHPLNDSTGFLEVTVREADGAGEGMPGAGDSARRSSSAWTVVELEVLLSRPEMGAAGFQASARFAAGDREGEQAGTLASMDGRAEVVEDPGTGLQYASQTRAGTRLTAPDTSVWRLRWIPPETPGPVVFHVAANAANHDDSEFGDHIYLAEARWCPSPDG